MALCIVAVDYLSYSERSEQSWKKNVFLFGFVNLNLNNVCNGEN